MNEYKIHIQNTLSKEVRELVIKVKDLIELTSSKLLNTDEVILSFLKTTGLTINGKVLFEEDIFSYKSHKGYLLGSFVGKVVWDKEFACFGYEKINDSDLLINFTPFNSHDELSYDFLPHCKIIGTAAIK